jgi:hypothetical protein
MAERNRVQSVVKSGARRSSITGHNKPVAGRMGRIQRQIRRALIALGRPLTIRELLPYCYPKAKTFQRWMRWSIHRAVSRVAKPLFPTRERHATTWRLR